MCLLSLLYFQNCLDAQVFPVSDLLHSWICSVQLDTAFKENKLGMYSPQSVKIVEWKGIADPDSEKKNTFHTLLFFIY